MFLQMLAPISVIFFFFYCYGDHRDLHSFPTRRSSDLAGLGLLIIECGGFLRIYHAVAESDDLARLRVLDAERVNSPNTLVIHLRPSREPIRVRAGLSRRHRRLLGTCG